MNAKTIILRFNQKAIDRTTAISLLAARPDNELRDLDITKRMLNEVKELKDIIANKS